MESSDQLEDDLLTPESPADGVSSEATPEDHALDGGELAAPRSVDAARSLIRLGWGLVVALIVFGVLTDIDLLSVRSAVNNLACIQRAEANHTATVGPHSSVANAGLGAFALRLALKSCGP